MSILAEDQSLSRRDRQKREREARILDAAAAVFAQKGFHQATIRDIAELADVADGTIYNYFDNKLHLLVVIMSRIAELERLPGELMQSLHGDVKTFFAAALRERMGRMQEGQEMLQAVLPEVFVNAELRQQFYQQYVSRISSLLEPYFQAQIDLGHIRPVDVPLTVRVVQAMIIGLLFLRILDDEPLRSRWHEVPEVQATLLFDGLRPGSGE